VLKAGAAPILSCFDSFINSCQLFAPLFPPQVKPISIPTKPAVPVKFTTNRSKATTAAPLVQSNMGVFHLVDFTQWQMHIEQQWVTGQIVSTGTSQALIAALLLVCLFLS
jgi:hypothetical protein